jgi:hypothetical protein
MGLSGDHERACISRAGVMLALRAALSRQAEKETA